MKKSKKEPREPRNKEKKPVKQPNRKVRIFRVMIAFFVLFGVIIGRMGWLQIVRASWLQEKAASQWTRTATVAAKRGKITDTNGIVLAQSASADTVEVSIKDIDEPEKVAQAFVDVLGLDYDTVYEKITNKEKSYVVIKRQITEEQSEALQAYDFDGVNFTAEEKRFYPLKNFLTQVIGYTTVDGTGQTGIEASQNSNLAGTPGQIVYEKDNQGREIPYGSEEYVEAVDGYNIALTADAVVQSTLEKAAQEALDDTGAETVTAIVLNVKTGAILGITTKPDFDLNEPPRSDLTQLQSLSRNRVVADTFEPGSVFEILTLAAALDSGTATQAEEFNCPGYKMVGGEKINCLSAAHGHETLAEGIKNSCSTVFMELALRMGTETFYEYLYNFGLGSTTNSGMSSEASGSVLNRKYVTNSDLACIGVGQSVTVTAIQTATAAAAAINGGKLLQPYIIKEIYSDDGTVIQKGETTVVRQVISEETSAIVREMLEGVVEDGDGKSCYIPGYRIGGKTGTSQADEDGKTVSSFLAFAPADDPEYLVYLVVSGADSADTGSTAAAPFVRNVMQDLLKYYNITTDYGDSTEGTATNVTVPDVSNMTLAEAKAALSAQGFTVSADGDGTVVSQAPQAGVRVPEGTQVQLYMSEPDETTAQEADTVIVPDLSGLNAGQAYTALREVGLGIQAAGAPRGDVVSQNPSAGSVIEKGSTVSVVLDDGSGTSLIESETTDESGDAETADGADGTAADTTDGTAAESSDIADEEEIVD